MCTTKYSTPRPIARILTSRAVASTASSSTFPFWRLALRFPPRCPGVDARLGATQCLHWLRKVHHHRNLWAILGTVGGVCMDFPLIRFGLSARWGGCRSGVADFNQAQLLLVRYTLWLLSHVGFSSPPSLVDFIELSLLTKCTFRCVLVKLGQFDTILWSTHLIVDFDTSCRDDDASRRVRRASS